jgi:cyanophycinase
MKFRDRTPATPRTEIVLLAGSVCLVCALLASTLPAAAAGPGGKEGGHLFIIGGGRRGPDLMKEYVRLAGGAGLASILVLPMASGDGDTTGLEMAQEFRDLGVRAARSLFITREQAMTPGILDQFTGVTGVYFTGGDQARITKELVGTPVQDKLKDLYRSGVVIGGTSAGAAVMSAVMLTGDEKLNRDTVNGFVFIRRDNVVVTEGLGFLTTVIVDQHFIRRKRMNRLISVVLEHAPHVGVGIDEATAVIVSPDSTFRVMGSGSVMVLDASQSSNVRNDSRGNMGADGLRMHLLLDGDGFDMRRLVPLPGRDSR